MQDAKHMDDQSKEAISFNLLNYIKSDKINTIKHVDVTRINFELPQVVMKKLINSNFYNLSSWT